jgi:5-formyltetrahydrofolate cyclo-ligase
VARPVEDRGSKPWWRARLRAQRRALTPPQRAALTNALVSAVAAVPGETICGFVPIGDEPGATDPAAVLAALTAGGRRLLLPVVTGAAPLDWARYEGPEALVDGPHRLREPAGPRLGPAAIGSAATVLVPALAVDRSGVRLGQGGGHYDRSLPLAGPGAALLAVVREAELVAELPSEPHDVRMTGILTPERGPRPLPG